MNATVHVGPAGGIQFRLWSDERTFKIVGKYKAWPHMTEAERTKAEAMAAERAAALAAMRANDAAWRDIMRGG